MLITRLHRAVLEAVAGLRAVATAQAMVLPHHDFGRCDGRHKIVDCTLRTNLPEKREPRASTKKGGVSGTLLDRLLAEP